MNADQVKELLSKATPGPWAYQHGWGIQYSQDGAVGLLIWPERGANATPVDLDLMAAAPDIAALAIAQAAEIERLREALGRTRGELNSAMVSMDVSSTLTRQYVYAAWDALSEVVWEGK